jgi:hypothetical protein
MFTTLGISKILLSSYSGYNPNWVGFVILLLFFIHCQNSTQCDNVIVSSNMFVCVPIPKKLFERSA